MWCFQKRSGTPQQQRGQSVPATALVLWAIAGVGLVLALLGGRVADRARAQAGADAAALAGSIDPALVGPLAATNGARVVGQQQTADGVRVTVQVGDMVATAQAMADRPAWVGLQPEVRRAIARAEAILGYEIPIVSGYRSPAEQQRLWNNRHTNPYPVAAPGTSRHERGLAIDVPLATAVALAPLSSRTGLCQPLPTTDPVHFVSCPTTPTS